MLAKVSISVHVHPTFSDLCECRNFPVDPLCSSWKRARVLKLLLLWHLGQSLLSQRITDISFLLTQGLKKTHRDSCHQTAWVTAPYFATVILKNKIPSLMRHLYTY